MKDIAIFGAGGFGREIACLINSINETSIEPEWNLIGYFDDGVEKGTIVSHYGEVLGGMDEVNNWNNELCIAIAIGSPKSLKSVRNRIVNKNISFPNIIHPDFFIGDKQTVSIGEGNIIQSGCSCTCDTVIGNFNILNGLISLGHDDRIGNYNVIMPAVHISGSVTIGEECLIGVGSIVLQQIMIGKSVRLGAGAVLMTRPKNGGTYIGNPATLLKY